MGAFNGARYLARCSMRATDIVVRWGIELNRLVPMAHGAPAGFCEYADRDRSSTGTDEQWLVAINVSRGDVGTGMTREECTAFDESDCKIAESDSTLRLENKKSPARVQ
jgi:hypothetical protein